jgi:hypothetical protein
MEYRGIEYAIVQTSNPTGWKWVLSIQGKRPKSGTGPNRLYAIRSAEKVIDGYLKEQARKVRAETESQETA